MATRATISIVKEDGTAVSVYNHYDGYESSLGKELKKFFTTESLILSLMCTGGIKGIYNARVDSFDDYEINKFKNEEELERYLSEYGENYNYIFKDGKWIIWES